MADTDTLVKQALLAAEALRDRHGWTQADFARALASELPPPRDHNRPPGDNVAELMEAIPLDEILQDLQRLLDLATPELRGRAGEIEAAAADPQRMKPPADDAGAGKLTQFIDLCTKAIKRARDTHDDMKEPYLRAGKTIDNYFNAIIERVTTPKNKALALLNAYQQAKRDKERELEKKRSAAYEKQGFAPPPESDSKGRVRGAGGTGSVLIDKPNFTIEDYEKLGIVKLRSFLDREAVEKALRAYLAHHMKTKNDIAKVPPIAGVRFHMAAQTRVHG